ncbi:hypothetical protein CROQUDRAFT_659604 [Cronartium quercuum f. sp. fusiforme G11]|uniref:Uncharacterized protein n=1 Tax=Cronartium quercuum f. sp. fusiforme G11 TaxID=708437 RepID=A0A9P6NIK9_9BASI|nr:hypothetical protein CROQUDRAFT_659604 [Cronartium quercuum f. sp. fusiforme G11]
MSSCKPQTDSSLDIVIAFILTVYSISHKTHQFTSNDLMTRPSLIASPLQIKVTISSCSELPAFWKYIW